MKGQIDEHGNLYIERVGSLRPQFCRKTQDPCGDDCPKFGEPYYSQIMGNKGEWVDGFSLRLCERDQLFFTEFDDYREKS